MKKKNLILVAEGFCPRYSTFYCVVFKLFYNPTNNSFVGWVMFSDEIYGTSHKWVVPELYYFFTSDDYYDNIIHFDLLNKFLLQYSK